MKKLPTIDEEALELSKRLMSAFGRMIDWRGMLTDEADGAYKALSEYVKHLEGYRNETD